MNYYLKATLFKAIRFGSVASVIEDPKKIQLQSRRSIAHCLKRIVGALYFTDRCKRSWNDHRCEKPRQPLVIGIGGANILASDATPIIEYTKEVVYVNDYGGIVRPMNWSWKPGQWKQTLITKLIWILPRSKRRLWHFMLKIHEQPDTIFDCLRGRIFAQSGQIAMGGSRTILKHSSKTPRIIIVACGTSWHAGYRRIPDRRSYAFQWKWNMHPSSEYRNPLYIKRCDIAFQKRRSSRPLVALERKRRIYIWCGECSGQRYCAVKPCRRTHSSRRWCGSTKALQALAVFSVWWRWRSVCKGTMGPRYLQLIQELQAIPRK